MLCPGKTAAGRSHKKAPYFTQCLRGVLSISLITLLLSGCFISRDTVNEPLNPVQIDELRPGVTTAKQAVELLGAPTDVVQLGRRSAYRFDFKNRKRAGLFLVVLNLLNDDTRSDRLWLFFDEDQLLTHYGATFSGDDAQYAMPWEEIRE